VADRPDLMALRHRAMNTVYDRLVSQMRKAKADLVTRPAVPLTDDPKKIVAEKPQSKDERRMEYLRLRGDSALIESMVEERIQRYKLQPGSVPRDVVDYFRENERELQRDSDAGGS